MKVEIVGMIVHTMDTIHIIVSVITQTGHEPQRWPQSIEQNARWRQNLHKWGKLQ